MILYDGLFKACQAFFVAILGYVHLPLRQMYFARFTCGQKYFAFKRTQAREPQDFVTSLWLVPSPLMGEGQGEGDSPFCPLSPYFCFDVSLPKQKYLRLSPAALGEK
jgi:hypothetical protein